MGTRYKGCNLFNPKPQSSEKNDTLHPSIMAIDLLSFVGILFFHSAIRSSHH